MTATNMESMKKDLLGINQIMNQDEKGQRQYKKCRKCNRPIFGHSKPGCGVDRCEEISVASEQESQEIWRELYGAKEGMFATELEKTKIKDLFHCGICLLDFCFKEDFENHKKRFHVGVSNLTCKECNLVWLRKEELVVHMRGMHYFTCVHCGLYFHGKIWYKKHEGGCSREGRSDEERREDVTKILEKLAASQESLAKTQDEMGRYQAQGDQRLGENNRKTTECLERLIRNQTAERAPIPKEQRFPDFGKDQDWETFKKKVLMWQIDTRLSKQGKVLGFTEAFEKRSQNERSHVENRIVQGDAIDFEKEDVLEQCLATYEEFFGKSLVEKTMEAWRELKKVSRGTEESLAEYIQRFGTIMMKMKNSELGNVYMIHPRLKAI